MTIEPEPEQEVEKEGRPRVPRRRRPATIALVGVLAGTVLGSVALAGARPEPGRRIDTMGAPASPVPSDPVVLEPTPSLDATPSLEPPTPGPSTTLPVPAARPRPAPSPTATAERPDPRLPSPLASPSPVEPSPSPMPVAAPDHPIWGLRVQWVTPPTWEWDADGFPGSDGGYKVSASFRIVAADASATSFTNPSRQVIIYGHSGSTRRVAAFTQTLVDGTPGGTAPSEALYAYATGFPRAPGSGFYPGAGTYVVDAVCMYEGQDPPPCRPAAQEEILSWRIPPPP